MSQCIKCDGPRVRYAKQPDGWWLARCLRCGYEWLTTFAAIFSRQQSRERSG